MFFQRLRQSLHAAWRLALASQQVWRSMHWRLLRVSCILIGLCILPHAVATDVATDFIILIRLPIAPFCDQHRGRLAVVWTFVSGVAIWYTLTRTSSAGLCVCQHTLRLDDRPTAADSLDSMSSGTLFRITLEALFILVRSTSLLLERCLQSMWLHTSSYPVTVLVAVAVSAIVRG